MGNRYPGIRAKGDWLYIEKRHKLAPSGWLRTATGLRVGQEAAAATMLAAIIEQLESVVVENKDPDYELGQAIEYFDELNGHLASHDDTMRHLREIEAFIGSETILADIIDDDLAEYRTARLAKDSVKTVNNKLEALRRLLNQAAKKWRDPLTRRTWLAAAPFIQMIPLSEHNPKRPWPLEMDELKALLGNLNGTLHDMSLFDFATGLREHNVCDLQWDWLQNIDGLNIIRYPAETQKNKRTRVVVLSDLASDIVAAHKGRHPTHVFAHARGPYSKMHTSQWKRAWRKTGLPDDDMTLKGVHNLRHTYGSVLEYHDVSVKNTKLLLGHISHDVTARYTTQALQKLVIYQEMVVDHFNAGTTMGLIR